MPVASSDRIEKKILLNARTSTTRASRRRSSFSAWRRRPGGIMLTVTESGFDRVPLARRSEAFTANSEGWAMMIKMIEKHLAQSA